MSLLTSKIFTVDGYLQKSARAQWEGTNDNEEQDSVFGCNVM